MTRSPSLDGTSCQNLAPSTAMSPLSSKEAEVSCRGPRHSSMDAPCPRLVHHMQPTQNTNLAFMLLWASRSVPSITRSLPPRLTPLLSLSLLSQSLKQSCFTFDLRLSDHNIMTNPDNSKTPLLRRSLDHRMSGTNPSAMTQPMVSIECGQLSSQLSELSLPPLDQVSMCSDDSVSLSSLSSEGSADRNDSPTVMTSSNQRRRSMFKSFWEKNGGAPLQLHGSAETSSENDDEVNTTHHDDDESQGSCCSSAESPSIDAANSYERTLKVKEGLERPRHALLDNSGRRRRIFAMACPSFLSEMPERPLPGLCFDYHNDVRLVQSNPELRRTPGPSCLQSACRYSGDKRRSFGRSSSCSVSFDPKISILRYRETKEHWAASGWSKYFAN